jgi:hypothetical protein
VRRLIGLVVVLLALALGADRLGVLYAEHRVEAALQNAEGLPSDTDVTIHGFPFLTQVLRGKYDDIEVTVKPLQARGSVKVTRIHVHLRGAHVSLSDTVNSDVRSVPVDRVDGSVLISYADLARAAGNAVTLSFAGAGAVRVTGGVSVAGTRVDASGVGRVRFANNRIIFTVDGVTVDGRPAPAAVTGAVRQSLGFSVRLPSVPFHIELGSVRATADGLVVSASARRITLGVG